MARRKPDALAREDQRWPTGRSRSVGSSHPAEADTVLAEAIYEEAFAKLQTRFRRRAAVVALGAVFACWRRVCVGAQHQFPPGSFFDRKPCAVR